MSAIRPRRSVLYMPGANDRALEKASEHAGNFLFNRTKQVEYLASLMGRPPIVLLEYNNDLMQQHYVTIIGYNNVTGKIIFHDSIEYCLKATSLFTEGYYFHIILYLYVFWYKYSI